MNMQAMMKQAQAMQKDMMEKKEKINKMEFEGTSSIVKVVVNGNKEVKAVEILDKENVSLDDIDLLQDMIVVAMNEAFNKVDDKTKEEMGQLASIGGLM